MEIRGNLQALDGGPPSATVIRFAQVLEAGFDLATAGVTDGRGLRFQLSLWQGGLPLDAVPQQGWIDLPSTAPADFSD